MNQVQLIGRLTRDPVLRFIPSTGTAVTRFGIAVNNEHSKEKEADFFNIIVWGKTAENVASFLGKGRLVAVSGSLRNNNYEDKNGTKHYGIEVVANRVEFLDYENKKPTQQQPTQEKQYASTAQTYGGFEGFQAIESDDDIPF